MAIDDESPSLESSTVDTLARSLLKDFRDCKHFSVRPKHSLFPLCCIFVHPYKEANYKCNHEHFTHTSKMHCAAELFSCVARTLLSHLKRKIAAKHTISPFVGLLTLRRSISLMQSCRALASIKSNIY